MQLHHVVILYSRSSMRTLASMHTMHIREVLCIILSIICIVLIYITSILYYIMHTTHLDYAY
jgi:hypothetical protein